MNRELIMILEQLLLPIAGSFFLFYILADGMIKLGCTEDVGAGKRTVIFAGYSVVALTVILFTPQPYFSVANLLFVAVGFPVLAHFICNRKRIYFIYYLGMTIGAFFLDLLLLLLFQAIVTNGWLYFQKTEFYNILYILMTRLMATIMVRIYVEIVQRREKKEISRRKYYAGLLLPLGSLLYVYTLVSFLQIYIDTEFLFLFIANVLLIFLLNIWYPLSEKNREEKNQMDMQQQKEQMQNMHYEELFRKYQESQSVLHDIRGHLQVMDGLYRESAVEQAGKYAQDVQLMLDELGERFYTGHKVLNMIINEKVSQMKKAGITPDIRIGNVSFEGFRDMDVTVIFDNILSNAVRAAAVSGTPYIRLRAEKVQEFISISLRNSVSEDEERILAGGSRFQGTGLHNVEKCVAGYKGDIRYRTANGEFEVQILLPAGEGVIV